MVMTIKLFDEQVVITPTGNIPKVLCIDEYHFETSKDSKYISEMFSEYISSFNKFRVL